MAKAPHRKLTDELRLKNERVKLPFIEHQLALTEVLAAFTLAVEAEGWRVNWSDEQAFHDKTGLPPTVEIPSRAGERYELPLHPDAFLTLTDDAGYRYHHFVEVDMGTEPIERKDWQRSSIRRKLLAYWHLFSSSLTRFDRQRDSFRVLTVTTTEERLHNMRDVARDVDPKKKGPHWFLFSTHARCRLEDPAALLWGTTWWSSKVGYDNPRPLFLPTCEQCHQAIDPSNEPHVIVNATPRLALAPASSPLPDLPPEEPVYAHAACPGLVAAPSRR
jgi:hypothetical protein